jgi:hypothetical protein
MERALVFWIDAALYKELAGLLDPLLAGDRREVG